jgi:two-component system response regulator AtoC
MEQNILILESNNSVRFMLEETLRTNGFSIHGYKKGIDGISALRKDDFSLVITDDRLPDMTGLDLLKSIKNKYKNIPVIIMTESATIKDAVKAMRQGAFDYITKPVSLYEFNLIAKRALEVKELREENIRLRRDLSDCYSYSNIVGESNEMQQIFELLDKLSKTDSTVLILGENGTGKELIASTIHYQSKRRNGPMIKVNCAAFPENLVESELFGYEKGAFTGATQKKPGRFERADKGTIFLDEIGELPLPVQMKLLRVLQDGTFEKLGGTETLRVDVRVITATNRDLEKDVKNGRFREDLFYRLNVIPIHMPALRARREDISLLIDYFIGIFNCRFGKRIKMSPDAINALMSYNFPGNVRELKNILELCFTLTVNDTIKKNDLPAHILKNSNNPSPINTLSEITAEAEKAQIVRILKSTKGNKTKASEILGVSRKTLWEKIKSYHIRDLQS